MAGFGAGLVHGGSRALRTRENWHFVECTCITAPQNHLRWPLAVGFLRLWSPWVREMAGTPGCAWLWRATETKRVAHSLWDGGSKKDEAARIEKEKEAQRKAAEASPPPSITKMSVLAPGAHGP